MVVATCQSSHMHKYMDKKRAMYVLLYFTAPYCIVVVVRAINGSRLHSLCVAYSFIK